MKRYLSSFIISVLLYSTLVGSMMYYFSNKEFSKKESEVKKESRIKVSLIAMVSPKKTVVTPTKNIEQKTSKVVQKKHLKPKPKKTKKIIRKKVIKKKEVIVQKKELLKQVIQKAVVVAPIRVEASPTLTNNKEVELKKLKLAREQEAAELLKKQNIFLAQLKEAINSNKTYPNTARRRNIQGDVKVKFSILSTGDVQKIEVIKGRSIFKRSVHEAIENSFPIAVGKTLFSFPKEFHVTLNYVLK